MAVVLSVPVLLVAYILQTVIISRLPLLHGYADLVMLVIIAWTLQGKVKAAWIWVGLGGLIVSYVSAAPMGLPFAGYLLIAFGVKLIQKRIWQMPILAMLVASVAGTLVQHFLTIIGMRIMGVVLPVGESLSLVTLPSILMNLILSIPVYIIIKDVADTVYPSEMSV